MPKLNKFSSKFLTFLISAIIVISVWATSASGQAQLTERSKLAINGIGPIRVGMTVSEASRSAGVKLVKALDGSRPDNSCAFFDIQGGPQGISFMTTKDRIVSVYISNERITTISGAKIGDSVAKILKLYPPAQMQTELSGRSQKRFTFIPRDAADRNYRLIFETDTGTNRVKRFRSGQLPEVEYREGCA
jgi:hypothetical protein